ncbi:MAG: trehalose-6-phosphate synthase [Alphaproteobacteria bacterium]
MTRLVVVSNRVSDLSNGSPSGGLAVALGDALRETGGLWFGWDGETGSDSGSRPPLQVQEAGEVTLATVPLSETEYRNYYLGFANSVLWPALHYRLDLVDFDTAFLESYRSVNERFAAVLSDLLRPDDVIWIQDYHLIPLAAELRRRGVRQRIGFFLHVPFPPPDMLAALPEHEWLAKSLFSCDVIGFQSAGDLHNFRGMARKLGGDTLDGGRIRIFGRTVTAGKFPIGIDVDAFRAMATNRKAKEIVEALRKRTRHLIQIIGTDRLDYTKGLPERLKAYRMLLERHPENRKRTTLMQIAAPSREDVDAYGDIRHELETLSGAINGEFADFDWTPIRYIHRHMGRNTLAALFRASKVGLVTPLRDGMNLVAKEYVAAQNEDDPGVLVLSRFAGAAEELTDALIVNPHDINEIAEALQRAVTMPLAERRARQKALMARVRRHDCRNWQRSFLAALTGGREGKAGAEAAVAAAK